MSLIRPQMVFVKVVLVVKQASLKRPNYIEQEPVVFISSGRYIAELYCTTLFLINLCQHLPDYRLV